MRMVGNMSSSVDYRVITIIDAPGMEKGRVTVWRNPTNRETKNRDTITSHREKKKELRKEREHSANTQLAEIMAL